MNDFADPKMDEVLAAEHVLGVTDATERRKTTVRMETDPAFAMRVAHWQTRLQGLNGGFVPVDPPAR
ncbi:MAG: anti-sigma factor, partial [Pseudomonadota bacterium]